jgi:rhodanese-related sulfurtransferase
MSFIKKIFSRKSDSQETAPATPAPPPMPEPEPITINELTPHQLKARLDNGDTLIVVDMRQDWEYQAGHIPGAMHMFIQDIPTRFQELPKDTDIVFQCWSGNTSLNASAFLIQNGWDAGRVFSLSGGIGGWSSAFGPAGLTQD